MDILENILKPIFYSVIIVLCVAGIILFFYMNDFAQEIRYYENGRKVEAIEYHNEIYLKKGE